MPPQPQSSELLSNLVMELHYTARPALDAARLLAAVQAHLPRSHLVMQGPESLSFGHPGESITVDGKNVPAQTFISLAKEDAPAFVPPRFLQQTFDWPGSAAAVAKSRSRLVLAELFSASLSPVQRLEAFNGVLRAVLETYPPVALVCVHAQKLVDPVVLLAKLSSGKPFDQVQPHVNVRFHVLTKNPGETIMDTLGLTTLNLPDFQCHFRQLDPNRMAPFLFNAAFHLYSQGLVIQSGSFLQGFEPSQRWKCTFEKALLSPDRQVIDINCGDPYVAGERPAVK